MTAKGMSEKRWRHGLDPEAMLKHLEGRASPRKLRLLACAACRYVWAHLVDERSRRAVEVAERHADGLASVDELRQAYAEACAAFGELVQASPGNIIWAAAAVHNACWYEDPWETTQRCLGSAADVAGWQAMLDVDAGRMAHAPHWDSLVRDRELGKMARLVREVFGNPFKPIAVEPAWCTEAVVSLARTIYDQREFSRLPELADLLQQRGCKSKAILEHGRDPRPHYRGCWVVDSLLRKS
jgi:hypothetical protein